MYDSMIESIYGGKELNSRLGILKENLTERLPSLNLLGNKFGQTSSM